MASLVNFRGLQVVSPSPTGDGGLAIQNDLESLATWSPKSLWGNGAPPTSANNTSVDFWPGSLWSTTATPPQLLLCTASTPTTANWSPVLMAVAQDSSPKLGGDLDASGHSISSIGNLGIGVAAASAAGIYLNSTIAASGTVRGIYFTPTFSKDVTNPIAVNGACTMTTGGVVAPNGYTYRADDWTPNGVTITNLHGFFCSNMTAGVNNFGFRGLNNVATGSWNLYMDGNAPNYLNGSLLIGTTTIPAGVTSNLILGDTVHIFLGSSTGTKIGTATTQKLGFWNASPVGQYSAAGTTSGFAAATGSAVLSGSTFTGNTGSGAYTIGDLVAALKTCGIIAS